MKVILSIKPKFVENHKWKKSLNTEEKFSKDVEKVLIMHLLQ